MVLCLEACHLLLGVLEVLILLTLLPHLVCRVTSGLQLAKAIKDRCSPMERVVPRNLKVPRMCTRRKLSLQRNLILIWFLCHPSTMLILCAFVVENLVTVNLPLLSSSSVSSAKLPITLMRSVQF
jgi:hypothetical protein